MARYRLRRPRSVRAVLEGLGTPEDAIDEAEQNGTAELLAIDGLVLPERGKFTLTELAEKVGAEPPVVEALWRSLGFVEPLPDEHIFTKRDVGVLKNLVALTQHDLVDEEIALQVARVLGHSMAQVATAVVDASESDLSGDRTHDLARDDGASLALRARDLLPFLSEVIDYTFRRHLRAAARRRVDVVTVDDGAGQAIGFADLVRFTEMSLQLREDELAALVGRFDELVHQVVVGHGGRIVKMIGDGAMFTVTEPTAGALIALELVDAAESDDRLTGLRVGLASGPVLARDGDLYGPVVNLASRLVTIGRAGAVNVSTDVRDAIVGDPRFALRSLGERSLRHIGDVRIYRLRPGPRWGKDLAQAVVPVSSADSGPRAGALE